MIVRFAVARGRKSPCSFRSIWNLFGSSKNPILDVALQTTPLPNLSNWSPGGLNSAAESVMTEYNDKWKKMEANIPTEPKELVTSLYALGAPVQSVHNFASLACDNHITESRWAKTAAGATQKLTMPHLQCEKVFAALEQAIPNAANNDEDLYTKLARQIQGQYKRRGVGIGDEESAEALVQLDNAAFQLESKFFGATTISEGATRGAKTKLADMYNILAIKRKQAELMGFDNYVELALHGRHWQATEIAAIHEQVANRARKVVAENPNAQLKEDLDMTTYLSLDGTLQGLFAIIRAMFGVVINEDANPQGWDPEVRLFHVMRQDTDEPIGSFYLDPYRRTNKSRTTYAGILNPQTAYIMCNIRPSAWSDMPTSLRLDDAVALWHEMGHVLQILLAEEPSADWNPAIDLSEVLPQFMEHFLFEKSIVETLVHLSGTSMPGDLILELQEERRTKKAFETLHRAFLGQLELNLFSRVAGEEESLVALQRRMVETYIPHNRVADADLSPLSQIMEANGSNSPVAQYRYLVSELVSAQLFENCTEEGLKDQNTLKDLGATLQEHVLSPGPTMNLETVLQGMKLKGCFSPEAYFKLYNL